MDTVMAGVLLSTIVATCGHSRDVRTAGTMFLVVFVVIALAVKIGCFVFGVDA